MTTDHAAAWTALQSYPMTRDKIGTGAELDGTDISALLSAGTRAWLLWWGENGPQPGDHWKMPHDFAEYAADQLDAEADAIQAPGVEAAKHLADGATDSPTPEAEVARYSHLRDRAEHLRTHGY